MSRASCISHPEGERLLLIRKWQLEACGQDACAAALLNLFEYWHNIKLEQSSQAKHYNEVAQRHGDEGNQTETLMQWHKTEQLEASLLNIFTKRRIQSAIQILVSLKFISIHRNPNPRFAFDKTKHFLFNPKVVNDWLNVYRLSSSSVGNPNESPNSDADVSMEQNGDIDRSNLRQSSGANCSDRQYKNDQPLEQNAPTVGAICTMQYTKITYQDHLTKITNQNTLATTQKNVDKLSLDFQAFWDKWAALTQKSINRSKAFSIFSTLMRNEEAPLLSVLLQALEMQHQEKALRQRFNLFIPQWPNPSTWLSEARWEDEVHLDESFYQDELLKRNSGITHNKQAIQQQREHYLDGQYKSRINGIQDESQNPVASRQDAVRQLDEEFRHRGRTH